MFEERHFQGDIRDVLLYDRALSDSEIGEIREGGEIDDGLIGWWPMNEGLGDKVYDRSGNENHGGLAGNPQWINGVMASEPRKFVVGEPDVEVMLGPVKLNGAFGGEVAFQWYFEGEAIPGATEAEYRIEAFSEADAGKYSVEVTRPDAEVKGDFSMHLRTGDDAPNMLIIYVDDLHERTFGFMGDPIIQTPEVDRLAEQGTPFRNAFATTSICVTSRANFITGRYAARTGIYMDGFRGLSAEHAEMLYPRRLREEAGYYTGYVGKWHLRAVPEGTFDNDQTFPGQGRFWDSNNPPGIGTHLTDRLGNQAAEMIREAPAGRPFAITVGFKAPHVQDGFDVEPYPATPSTAVLYELDTMPAPPNSEEEFFESQPEFIRESLGRVRWEYRLGPPQSLNFQRSLRRYYRMVTGVDEQLGKMREALRETGRDGNTIIVFTSDHGMYLGERGLAGKWLGHEPSIRIPLVVYDPRMPESERGEWRDEMALMIDFKPTFLEWAGLSPSEGVQGTSLVPVVAGNPSEDWRTEFFYEHHSYPNRIPRSEGVRSERYKYLRYLDSDPVYEELYDLETDPHESNNLADNPEYSELLEQMREKWEYWREKTQ